MTPDTTSKQKISASFIFSSCKKKPLTTSNCLPGHTILVDDSSDEELIRCDSSTDVANANQNADTVDESLIEYSLIRKWLQNAEESSTPTEDSDVKSNSFEENSRKNYQIYDRVCKLNRQTALRNPGDNTVVLSSDDEICVGFGKIAGTVLLSRKIIHLVLFLILKKQHSRIIINTKIFRIND